MSLLSTLTTNAKAPPWPPSALDGPRRSAEAELWDAIGTASATIGEETFYDRLLEVPAALVEADLLSLVRYSSFGAPDLVIPREIRAEVAAPYNSGLYAFDPFHHYWRTVARPTVTSLRRLAPAEMWKSRYALEFMRAARISDEIAVFLPPLGGASPTLILDRAKGGFTSLGARPRRARVPAPGGSPQRASQIDRQPRHGRPCRGEAAAPDRSQRQGARRQPRLEEACRGSGKQAHRGCGRARRLWRNRNRPARWPAPDQVLSGG